MTDRQDTSLSGTLDGGGLGAGEQSSPDQNSAKPEGDGQNFLLNYATAEDAERGYKEAQGKITEQASRVKELEAQVQMGKRMEMLEQIQEQNQSTSLNAVQEMEQRKATEELDRLRQMIEEDPTKSVDLYNDLAFRHKKELKDQENKLMEMFESKIAASNKATEQRFLQSSPDFQTYSEEIGKLRSDPELSGLSDKQLLSMARVMVPDKLTNTAGALPVGGAQGLGYSSPAPKQVGFSDFVKEGMKEKFGYSDEKIAAAEARYIAQQEVA
jgi:hypothetical protein